MSLYKRLKYYPILGYLLAPHPHLIVNIYLFIPYDYAKTSVFNKILVLLGAYWWYNCVLKALMKIMCEEYDDYTRNLGDSEHIMKLTPLCKLYFSYYLFIFAPAIFLLNKNLTRTIVKNG